MDLSFAPAMRHTPIKKLIASRFIFEVIYGGGKAPVLHHVGIALQPERQLERNRLRERFVLKNAIADELAGHLGQHKIFARIEDVYPADFDFLVQLLGFEFGFFGILIGRCLLISLFQKHLLQQILIIKTLRVALQKGRRRQRALFNMKRLGFLEFQQRRDIKSVGGVNDDHPLPLLETLHEEITVNCRAKQHEHGKAKPKPDEPVFLDKDSRRIKTLFWLGNFHVARDGCFPPFSGFHWWLLVFAAAPKSAATY